MTPAEEAALKRAELALMGNPTHHYPILCHLARAAELPLYLFTVSPDTVTCPYCRDVLQSRG